MCVKWHSNSCAILQAVANFAKHCLQRRRVILNSERSHTREEHHTPQSSDVPLSTASHISWTHTDTSDYH